jgi:branched-chain amino acid transport system permease protein
VRLYYAGLVLSVLAYVGFVLIRRAPFGVALEGVRDDPIRMASLGFHVPLHRTLAFTLAGLVAATAGVLNIWWNGQIDPNTVSIGSTIDLLVIAVIGGIANNYLRDLPFADDLGLTEARFNTVVGLLVLAIVVLSPDGLMGLILQARNRSGSPAGRVRPSAAPPEPTDAGILANSS